MKWEYCQITWSVINGPQEAAKPFGERYPDWSISVHVTSFTASGGRVTFFGSKEIKTISLFAETMTQLGLDGWEMVSHAQRNEPATENILAVHSEFFFKRPLLEYTEYFGKS